MGLKPGTQDQIKAGEGLAGFDSSNWPLWFSHLFALCYLSLFKTIINMQWYNHIAPFTHAFKYINSSKQNLRLSWGKYTLHKVQALASHIHHLWASNHPQGQEGLLLTISNNRNTISYGLYFSDTTYIAIVKLTQLGSGRADQDLMLSIGSQCGCVFAIFLTQSPGTVPSQCPQSHQ